MGGRGCVRGGGGVPLQEEGETEEAEGTALTAGLTVPHRVKALKTLSTHTQS